EIAESVSLAEPLIPIVSNVTGVRVSSELTQPEYWVSHIRETVRFFDGVRFLVDSGVTRYLELGPDGALSAMASQCLDRDRDKQALHATCLRADRAEAKSFLEFLASIVADGVEVDWRAVLDRKMAARAELPTYAFQRTRFW